MSRPGPRGGAAREGRAESSAAPTIWDVVAAEARRRPDAPALRGEAEADYAELLARAARLAGELRARVRPGRVVALEAETSGLAATALLATARSGTVLLPLDPASPPLHRRALIRDARPALLVREIDPETYAFAEIDQGGETAPEPPELFGIAYLLSTSGSTGRPKAVQVNHRALIGRLYGMAARPGFKPGESFLGMAAATFDVWLAEAMMPLAVGGSVVVAPARARQDPEAFAEVVRAHRPNVLQATPSFWRLALAAGWDPAEPVDRIWCGGEALTPTLARRLLPRCAELWNVYGPTETTVWATCALVRDPEAIELGEPVPGSGLCLVNADGATVTRPGEQGEILLYGSGVAAGYLRRPDLTEQRFHPYDTPDGRRRCYRTGDLARYREDGSLEYLGRADGQVKLRGHRVELGGIEAVAEEHPAVREAAAVLCDTDRPRSAHIALFVVADGSVSARELRPFLAERLPAGARPARISVQPSLPRTTSGKVDRVALAAGARTPDPPDALGKVREEQ